MIVTTWQFYHSRCETMFVMTWDQVSPCDTWQKSVTRSRIGSRRISQRESIMLTTWSTPGYKNNCFMTFGEFLYMFYWESYDYLKLSWNYIAVLRKSSQRLDFDNHNVEYDCHDVVIFPYTIWDNVSHDVRSGESLWHVAESACGRTGSRRISWRESIMIMTWATLGIK